MPKPLMQVDFQRDDNFDLWHAKGVGCLCEEMVEKFIAFPSKAETLHFSIYAKKPKRTCYEIGVTWCNVITVDGKTTSFYLPIWNLLDRLSEENELKPLFVVVEWS